MPYRDEILKLIVKCLKNPRSAVCKTAIMTSSDIFKAYNDSIIESFDPLVSFVISLLVFLYFCILFVSCVNGQSFAKRHI